MGAKPRYSDAQDTLLVFEFFCDSRGKCPMAVLCKVNTVEGEFDIPVTGIDKGNIQLPGKKAIFFGKPDGIRSQRICGNPGTALHGWGRDQEKIPAMGERLTQKSFHPGGGILWGSTLQKIIGAQHHQKNMHRLIFLQRRENIWISRDLSAIGSAVDDLPACLLCQQVRPSSIITAAKVTPWIVAIGIGISETQYPHCNHLRI